MVCQKPKKVHRAVAILMRNYSQANSSEERKQYLEELADEYDVDVETVFVLADILGPNEDHDGLITSLEDFTQSIF